MKSIIIASGSSINEKLFNDIYTENDFVICADGGLNYLDGSHLVPDLIVGDFDSVDSTLLSKYKNVEIKKFIPEKDFTDTEIAIEEAINRGYKEIILIGATGTRLDHTLANMLLIERYVKDGINIKVIDNNNFIQILNKDIELDKKEGYYLSIVPITDCIYGITLKGFKYPLNNVDVKRGSTLCISNEIVSARAEIKITNGLALLFLSRD